MKNRNWYLLVTNICFLSLILFSGCSDDKKDLQSYKIDIVTTSEFESNKFPQDIIDLIKSQEINDTIYIPSGTINRIDMDKDVNINFEELINKIYAGQKKDIDDNIERYFNNNVQIQELLPKSKLSDTEKIVRIENYVSLLMQKKKTDKRIFVISSSEDLKILFKKDSLKNFNELKSLRDTINHILMRNKNSAFTIIYYPPIISNSGSAESEISITSPASSITPGQQTKLTAEGGETYIWSTGEKKASISVKPKESTTYTVTGTKGGSSYTSSITITVNINDKTVNPTKGGKKVKQFNLRKGLNENSFTWAPPIYGAVKFSLSITKSDKNAKDEDYLKVNQIINPTMGIGEQSYTYTGKVTGANGIKLHDVVIEAFDKDGDKIARGERKNVQFKCN